MPRRATHAETHKLQHASWLRAAVLGANDGLISTAGLVVGMAAAGTDAASLLALRDALRPFSGAR